MLRLARYLTLLDEAFASTLESPKEIDLDHKQDMLAPIASLMTSGITQCFFDPDKAHSLTQDSATLRLISSYAFGISFRAGDHKRFLEMTRKFPQTNTNSKMALIQMQSAVSTLEESPNMTFDTFLKILARKSAAVLEGLRGLDEQCRNNIKEDSESLKRMAIIPRRT
jgi:hypothetical protein